MAKRRSDPVAGHRYARAPMTARVSSLRRSAAALALLAALATACSNTGKPTLEAAPAASTTTAPVTTTTVPDTAPIGPHNLLGYIATPTGAPQVHEAPDASSPAVEIGETTPAGAPMTFAVVGTPADGDAWLRVVLPTRPNDHTGFVPADSVTVTRTDLRAFVDLAARTLVVERDGADVARYTVAVGTTDNPTPVGAGYVTELLETPAPDGAYGPYAFGLSLHSDQITEFGEGGDGQVGIHGTNRPDLIGEAVSHGCVRLDNDDIRALVALEVPLGMPVFVT